MKFPDMDFSTPASSAAALSFADISKDCEYVLIDFWATWCGPFELPLTQILNRLG